MSTIDIRPLMNSRCNHYERKHSLYEYLFPFQIRTGFLDARQRNRATKTGLFVPPTHKQVLEFETTANYQLKHNGGKGARTNPRPSTQTSSYLILFVAVLPFRLPLWRNTDKGKLRLKRHCWHTKRVPTNDT